MNTCVLYGGGFHENIKKKTFNICAILNVIIYNMFRTHFIKCDRLPHETVRLHNVRFTGKKRKRLKISPQTYRLK